MADRYRWIDGSQNDAVDLYLHGHYLRRLVTQSRVVSRRHLRRSMTIRELVCSGTSGIGDETRIEPESFDDAKGADIMSHNQDNFSIEELLNGDIEVWQIIEPMIDHINLSNKIVYEQTMKTYTRPQRLIFAVEVYMAEVNNGGHEQFFFNSSGVVWKDVIEGLVAIGAKEVAEILTSAVGKLASQIPDDAEKRRAMIEKMEEGLFEEEDDAFYGIDIDLAELELDYIRKHAADFVMETKGPEETASIPSGYYQALYYDGSYYLPVEHGDLSTLLAKNQHTSDPICLKAIELREESETEPGAYELGVCLAPYFIADYLKEPEELVLEHPEEVYPAEVELLTQKEYNARLREQVMKHCEGCRGFGGLTKNDSSLSGHFEEITLNGFCPYRWETRNSPRNFVNELCSFGEYWGRYNYAAQSADDLIDDIKFNLKLAYTSGAILDDANGRTLILSAKKPTLIQTVLTDILGKCVSEYWEEGYHIRLNDRAEVNEDAVMNLLTPKKIATTRKEFSKYGVMIGILEFDPSGDSSVRHLLNQLVAESIVWVLHEESGKVICLLTGKVALMRLRCASPMMEKYSTVVTVYDAQQTAQYRINYDMPLIVQDAVPVSASKENKLSKRILKAQEGKVLNYDQVFQLFSYLENRLAAAGCDNTLKYTEICLKDMLPPDRYEAAIEEIQSMGGFCDCEVLLNCYEDYELE